MVGKIIPSIRFYRTVLLFGYKLYFITIYIKYTVFWHKLQKTFADESAQGQ